MSSLIRATLATVVALALAPAALAQVNRAAGKVVDPDGKAVEGASVTFTLDDKERVIETNKKGEWAVMGLDPGEWNVDIVAEGFEPRRFTLPLGGASRVKPITIELEIAKPKGPPPEIRASLEAGDAAFQARNFEQALVEYDKALAAIEAHEATLTPELIEQFYGVETMTAIYQQIAYCHKEVGNTDKVLEYLQRILDAKPDDGNAKALLALTAIDNGDLERGMKLLGELEGVVTNPDVFFNVGVQLLNRDKREEAVEYFTKAVTADPAYVDGYNQRGLTYFGLQKLDEAKADFEKVIELDPEGPHAELARKVLDSLAES